MIIRAAIGCGLALTLGLTPAQAQSVQVNRSSVPDQPYTLIYPETMVASGEPGGAITLNHPNAPLQCALTIVTVEDTDWTAEIALASLDDDAITASWSDDFVGFVLGTKSTTPYQTATALIYEGTSTDSPMGVPLTIVHTETVDDGRGYTLDCFYATAVEAQARPLVDFIIANFATRSDAEAPPAPDGAPAP